MDMATYSTIGADEADKALLEKPKTSLKGLVAGAAVASFILGVMAAVATTPAAVRGEAAFIAAPGAAKPFHFSRVVDSVAPGYGFKWTFEPAASCTSDQYGAATCDWDYGEVIQKTSLVLTSPSGELTFGLEAKLSGDFSVTSSGITLPLEFSCALCGAPCTINVPLLGAQSFTPKPCPLVVPAGSNIFDLPGPIPSGPTTLPASMPAAEAKGTLMLSSGATGLKIFAVDFDLTASG